MAVLGGTIVDSQQAMELPACLRDELAALARYRPGSMAGDISHASHSGPVSPAIPNLLYSETPVVSITKSGEMPEKRAPVVGAIATDRDAVPEGGPNPVSFRRYCCSHADDLCSRPLHASSHPADWLQALLSSPVVCHQMWTAPQDGDAPCRWIYALIEANGRLFCLFNGAEFRHAVLRHPQPFLRPDPSLSVWADAATAVQVIEAASVADLWNFGLNHIQKLIIAAAAARGDIQVSSEQFLIPVALP